MSIAAITAFDCILSGNLYKDTAVPERSQFGIILKALFGHILQEEESSSFIENNPYLCQTMKCFIRNKERMEINFHQIYEHVNDKILIEVLFYYFIHDELDDSTWFRRDLQDSKKNVIKPELFQIFRYVKEVYISGTTAHAFSLVTFLSTIANTSINKVEIEIHRSFQPEYSYFAFDFDAIKDEYKEKQFNMIHDNQRDIHCIAISKV